MSIFRKYKTIEEILPGFLLEKEIAIQALSFTDTSGNGCTLDNKYKLIMKTLLIFTLLLLTSCGCLLSQVPPQTLYVNQNCEGILPDYRTRVIVTDNCPSGTTLLQSPIAGTLLTVLNPSVIVVITARDAYGNVSKPLNIPVTLIDTIAPILSFPIGQANMTEEDVVNLYKNFTAAIKIHGIARWIYDQKWTQGMAFVDTARIQESLKYFNNVIKLTDEEYAQYVSYMAGK